jgi:hypothetical protein
MGEQQSGLQVNMTNYQFITYSDNKALFTICQGILSNTMAWFSVRQMLIMLRNEIESPKAIQQSIVFFLHFLRAYRYSKPWNMGIECICAVIGVSNRDAVIEVQSLQ